MILSDSALKTFYPVKTFQNNTASINSIDFNLPGEILVTASDDDSINMYDCIYGKQITRIFSKKYGCENIKYTHATNCVLHSSNKINHMIRYLSLYDFKYLRYFNGHKGKVFDMCMSPDNDVFISVSEDKTARIWDIRCPNSQGIAHPNSDPLLVRIDPKGLIFSVATLRKTLLLYDLRSFDKGPFYEFSVPISSKIGPPEPNIVETSTISSYEFSADGQRISTLVLNGVETVVSVIDSFEGRVFSCVSSPPPYGYMNESLSPKISCKKIKINISGTPNSNYFFSIVAMKRHDLYMHAWRFDNGQPLSLFNPCVNDNTCKLSNSLDKGYHCTITKFNHKFAMMASTCDNDLILWQPDIDKTKSS